MFSRTAIVGYATRSSDRGTRAFMPDHATPDQIRGFAAVLRSTERWLDQHIDLAALAPAHRQLAVKLRKYLAHCRSHIVSGKVPLADLERRRQKILNASFVLWQSVRPKP
jgi:hypothetical protein